MTHHLVILQGGGDTEIKLVTAEQFAWINSPRPAHARGSSWIEKDPGQPEEPEEGEELRCTSGSFNNDRAIRVNGTEFGSSRAAFLFAKKHKFVISEDEYHGYIY